MNENEFFGGGEAAAANACSSYVDAGMDGVTGGPRVLAGVAALSDQDVAVLSCWTTELRNCLWCRVRYLEINNVGGWQCHQHIGALIEGSWTCCRRWQGQRGCVRGHHRWCLGVYSEHEAPLVISLALARRIGLRHLDASTLSRPDTAAATALLTHDVVVIQRYDARAALVVFETRRPLEETYAYDARKAALAKVPRALREFW